MFIFLNNLTSLDTIIGIINSNNNPKIVFSDFNFFINKRNELNEHTSMFDISFKKFLSEDKLLEFIVFSNTHTPKQMEDGFIVNNLLDSIYNQSIFNINFFKENRHNIDTINNLVYINNIDQNKFLYSLCMDDFYSKPYSEALHIYILFASVKDVIEFVLQYKIPKNVSIILYNTKFNYLKEYEEQIFEFINNIIKYK